LSYLFILKPNQKIEKETQLDVSEGTLKEMRLVASMRDFTV
jgi:hypothetical protein